MTVLASSLVLLALLLVLLVGGVWIAISLAVVAWAGLQFLTSSPPDVNLFQSFWGSSASWTLAALPLFVWMGEIVYRTRLSDEMFEGLAPWLGWLPGRLMHVNILGCAIFGTVSGSSTATCATIAKVALPELKKRGYDEKVCLGLASRRRNARHPAAAFDHHGGVRGGGRGVYHQGVPRRLHSGPSSRLFFRVHRRLGSRQSEKTLRDDTVFSLKEKIYKARHLIPCVLLILFIIWVMVAGWATATEAAAYGVLGALAIAWWSGGLDRASLVASLMGATRLSCMIMFILAGASSLSSCMAFTGIPRALAEWVAALEPNKYMLIAILAAIYILLGTALDGVSMIVLTTSVVLPMVEKAGFDLVWFGIFVVLLVEIAELTPPLGFNIFVLQNMTGRDSTTSRSPRCRFS